MVGSCKDDIDLLCSKEEDKSPPVYTTSPSVSPSKFVLAGDPPNYIQKVIDYLVTRHNVSVRPNGVGYSETTSGGVLIRVLTNDRNCAIKGGEHSSNHVYYMVKLSINDRSIIALADTTKNVIRINRLVIGSSDKCTTTAIARYLYDEKEINHEADQAIPQKQSS
jgi:hypothetical protein